MDDLDKTSIGDLVVEYYGKEPTIGIIENDNYMVVGDLCWYSVEWIINYDLAGRRKSFFTTDSVVKLKQNYIELKNKYG